MKLYIDKIKKVIYYVLRINCCMNIKIFLFLIILGNNLFSEENFGIYFIPNNEETLNWDELQERVWGRNNRKNGFLTIYGISDDDKIFYSTSHSYSAYLYIYDLRNNEVVSWWHSFMISLSEINTIAAEYNIKTINENVRIESFPLLYKNTVYMFETMTRYVNQNGNEVEIIDEYYGLYDRNVELYFLEKNNSIKLGTMYVRRRGGGIFMHTFKYYYFRNPFEGNKIIIVAVIDVETGGNEEYLGNEYLLFGYDLSQLNNKN
jgi:hypothetical protein